jgi:ferric-dicitrate binding protein FerR (iron transport regulator)
MQVTAKAKRSTLAVALVATPVMLALVLVLLRLHFQPPLVPTYELAGAPTEVTLKPGERFEMNLRPAVAVQGAIGARAFLLRGNEVRPWDAPFSVSADGAVRIAGPVDLLFAGVPRGRWEVAVAVGRPELLPTAPRDILHGRNDDPRPSGWRLVREQVRLEG